MQRAIVHADLWVASQAGRYTNAHIETWHMYTLRDRGVGHIWDNCVVTWERSVFVTISGIMWLQLLIFI